MANESKKKSPTLKKIVGKAVASVGITTAFIGMGYFLLNPYIRQTDIQIIRDGRKTEITLHDYFDNSMEKLHMVSYPLCSQTIGGVNDEGNLVNINSEELHSMERGKRLEFNFFSNFSGSFENEMAKFKGYQDLDCDGKVDLIHFYEKEGEDYVMKTENVFTGDAKRFKEANAIFSTKVAKIKKFVKNHEELERKIRIHDDTLSGEHRRQKWD